MTRHAHTIRRFLEYQDEDRQFYLEQLLPGYMYRLTHAFFSLSLFAEAMPSTTTDPARSDDAPGPARPSRSTCAWFRPITVFIAHTAFRRQQGSVGVREL